MKWYICLALFMTFIDIRNVNITLFLLKKRFVILYPFCGFHILMVVIINYSERLRELHVSWLAFHTCHETCWVPPQQGASLANGWNYLQVWKGRLQVVILHLGVACRVKCFIEVQFYVSNPTEPCSWRDCVSRFRRSYKDILRN